MTAMTYSLPISGIAPNEIATRAQHEAAVQAPLDDLAAQIEVLRNGRIDALTAGVHFVGEWSAASGAFPTARPDGSSIIAGDAWYVITAGTTRGVAFTQGDRLVALVPTPGPTYAGKWLRARYDDYLEAMAAYVAEAEALVGAGYGMHPYPYVWTSASNTLTLPTEHLEDGVAFIMLDTAMQLPGSWTITAGTITFSQVQPVGRMAVVYLSKRVPVGTVQAADINDAIPIAVDLLTGTIDPTLSFPTRADFVTWRAANSVPYGAVIQAGGYWYRYIGAGAGGAISDLAGCVPHTSICPDHFTKNAIPGITDMTSACQDAIDYAVASGEKIVKFSHGKTYLCGILSLPFGVSLDLTNVTILVAGPSFLNIHGGDYNGISDVIQGTIIASQAPIAGSYGIKANADAFSDKKSLRVYGTKFPRIDAITFNAFGFDRYVDVNNLYYPVFDHLQINGVFNPQISPSGQYVDTAIYVGGQTIGAKIETCGAFAVHDGIVAPTSAQEGLQISECELVGVRRGYSLASSTFGGPGVWMSNCHVNATKICFDFGNRIDVVATGCSAYRSSVLFDENWIGFDVSGTYNVRLGGCTASNSIVSGMNMCKAIRLLNTVAMSVNDFAVTFCRHGIIHEGGCDSILYSGVQFLGSGSYTQTAFETSATDDNVKLSGHSFRGIWVNKYVIATPKDGIIINMGRLKYNRTTSSTEAGGGTRLLTAGTSPQYWRVGLSAGAGAYDFNYDLSISDARDGDYFDFYVNLPSAADRRLIFRSGSGGTVLATMATTASKRYWVRAVFNGTAWQIAWINESVFI